MDIQSIPLFAMLRSRMGYLTQREQVIAQNVANVSTPGFTPQDLKPFAVDKGGAGARPTLVQTNPGHLTGVPSLSGGAGGGAGQGFQAVAAPDSDSTLDGNQVVLEDEMMKMNQTRSDYDAAVGIYQKAMSFLQMAAQEPGKG